METNLRERQLAIGTLGHHHPPTATSVYCRGAVELANHAAFKTAPSGTSPVVRYRHNAIINLRARATIAIRRTRPQ